MLHGMAGRRGRESAWRDGLERAERLPHSDQWKVEVTNGLLQAGTKENRLDVRCPCHEAERREDECAMTNVFPPSIKSSDNKRRE